MEILKPWLSVKKKIDSHYTYYDNDTDVNCPSFKLIGQSSDQFWLKCWVKKFLEFLR